MTVINQNLNDYTEADFLQFVRDIVEVNSSSEEEHHTWVSHFEKIVEHPEGNGVIYYPEDDNDGTPEGIVKFVKNWRKSQDLPLFKDSK
ncbi:bacteriocin immunity protein [Pectobacterium polaris]|uniref:bacteriocin immunity protein n=1 Tax=Pectobacterium TaxID=122277 RepID=UPI000B330122|nr:MULTISPECIES: bacteriocin immunity protein [Pectobacterium]ASY75686.1 bacteriocin immunity protein [Pectobacterium polaris]MBN3192856.1 bacteriocin immunity protein [Pectobacterium versatile]MBN3214473.1 bacteriocin immunity protein [Pectobacterium polaris]MCU1789906.1 bacteriocin immunity protein [Pectobacterium polaris]PWD62781.1 bacteriocin immunity protein [Pectobacterium polaris]